MNVLGKILLPVLAFFLPLLLYLLTLAPTYIPVDSAEFALCMYTWGICHSPGFPLYVLVGKIFTQLFPFGSIMFKANLLSALFGAATILLVYLTLVKLKVRTTIALFLSFLFAVSPAFWEFSIAADVFTFNTFLLALTFFLAFTKKQMLSFFVLGLSASHFYLSAILAPLFVWYYWGFRPGLKILTATGLFVLGLFPQIIMYVRMLQNPEINWGHVQNLGDFFNFIRRKEFGSFFLISNPVLTFSVLKFFRHIAVYFYALVINLGLFVPIFMLGYVLFGKMLKNRTILFLLLSFLAILFFQLLTLSSIDPINDKAFQINKFYLSSFVIAILVVGGASISVAHKKVQLFIPLVLGVLVTGSLILNFKSHDYSQNYFSRNLVLDALEELPPDAIGITTNHEFYFGTRYEQIVSGKFTTIKLLYFPNEKNRDAEKYHPELFTQKPNEEFIAKVTNNSQLKDIKPFVAEKYILETIARNMDKPIFILQGALEEQFFTYLRPYTVTYGLWWKVNGEQDNTLLHTLRNANVKAADFHLYQQRKDALTYAIAYHSAGIALAKEGSYDEALAFLKKSLSVDPQNKNVQNEITLVEKTKAMEDDVEGLVSKHNKDRLLELGNNLVTLGNYKGAVEVFLRTITIDPNDGRLYTNVASSYALMGEVERAKEFYRKALTLDPNLELAKKGLEALER